MKRKWLSPCLGFAAVASILLIIWLVMRGLFLLSPYAPIVFVFLVLLGFALRKRPVPAPPMEQMFDPEQCVKGILLLPESARSFLLPYIREPSPLDEEKGMKVYVGSPALMATMESIGNLGLVYSAGGGARSAGWFYFHCDNIRKILARPDLMETLQRIAMED